MIKRIFIIDIVALGTVCAINFFISLIGKLNALRGGQDLFMQIWRHTIWIKTLHFTMLVTLIVAPILFLVLFIEDFRRPKDSTRQPHENFHMSVGAFILGIGVLLLCIDFLKIPPNLSFGIFIAFSALLAGYLYREHGYKIGFVVGLLFFVMSFVVYGFLNFKLSKNPFVWFQGIESLLLAPLIGPLFGRLGELSYKKRLSSSVVTPAQTDSTTGKTNAL